ncbi:PREDICTED: centromere protein C, partial [Acanthisitta chloris]|uniref:centromere protein C n=1 Tax=Acanthisitta chloris TaxID=57068 RepID=UPI0004F0D847
FAYTQNHLKKGYRARFCHGGGNKIDIQPGQNVLELIQDCFESCSPDLTINSPSATRCSTPVARDEKSPSMQSQRPAVCDYIAASEKTESQVSKRENPKTPKDVETQCQSPALYLDPEDDHRSVGVPSPVEEVKTSVAKLCSDDCKTTAAAESHVEVENLEGPQTGRDEQDVLVQVTTPVAASSAQKKEYFSSAVLAAVARGIYGERYSALLSSPSTSPVEDGGVENDCEFLIDVSDSESDCWISIPNKNKKSKRGGSATAVSKSQPSEKKTQSKKGKNRQVEVEPLCKQKLDDVNVGVHDFRGMPVSDPIPDSEETVHKSQSQKITHMGKTKKDAVRQDSAKQKKNTSWKPAAQKLMSWSDLKTKVSDEEQCKTKVLPSKDLPMPSSGYQQEQIVSPKQSLKSWKNLQSASKASQEKKQASREKKQASREKKQASREKKQASREKKQASREKKQASREKKQASPEKKQASPEKKQASPEKKQASPEKKQASPEKKQASPEKKQASPEKKQASPQKKQASQRKLPKTKVAKGGAVSPRRKCIKSVQKSSNKKPPLQREESSDSEPDEEELEREPVPPLWQKLRTPMFQKHTLQSCGSANNKTPVKALQHPMDSAKNSEKKRVSVKSSGKIPKKIPHRTSEVCSGPEDTESQTDSDSSSVEDMARKKRKLPDVKTKNDSEDRNNTLKELLMDELAKQKIVMPTNTPHVRRTKRIRLKPLEYWRGERVNYMITPSDGREVIADLDGTIADSSKPTLVLDPVTKEEVLVECINRKRGFPCYFKDEAVEIYKHLNTSVFATGRLVLKPLKEKGHQFVHMDTIAFHIMHGKILVTLHETSYYLSSGDYFYVPAGNRYNMRNLLNEESVLLFTQLKCR